MSNNPYIVGQINQLTQRVFGNSEADKWRALADQLAEALGHSWFAAKVDQRGKLMDFLEKKKAALAAYEEANK